MSHATPRPVLSEATRALVRASVPALAEHGTLITTTMYRRLFQDASIRALFNQANQDGGSQPAALAGAILAYARHIDDLGALAGAVERMAQKHIAYHILPEHYPSVAKALLGAIGEVLGEAATPELLAAWGEAYWFLADLLIAREAAIRSEIEADAGGWRGWRRFTVAQRIVESELIVSFVLRPADGGAVLPHKPGQYLTLRLATPQGEIKRNYSISCGPNADHYRISVKREAQGHGGSRYLHDAVAVGDSLEATPPSGDFYLPDAPSRPVLLLSGGVGLTPMVSMLETIAAKHPQLETHYVHGTANSASHAMDAHVRRLASGHGRMRVASFYCEPRNGDAPGKTHDVDGLIDIAWLRSNTPLDQADVYLCGPRPFLRRFVQELAQAGVPGERIHYEFFGPSDEALAA